MGFDSRAESSLHTYQTSLNHMLSVLDILSYHVQNDLKNVFMRIAPLQKTNSSVVSKKTSKLKSRIT